MMTKMKKNNLPRVQLKLRPKFKNPKRSKISNPLNKITQTKTVTTIVSDLTTKNQSNNHKRPNLLMRTRKNGLLPNTDLTEIITTSVEITEAEEAAVEEIVEEVVSVTTIGRTMKLVRIEEGLKLKV